MHRLSLLGLLMLGAACGAPIDEGEPIALEDAELSTFPKGHIAVAETSHTSPPSLFASWGWLYYKAPNDPGFTLLSRTSTAPKALAAVRIPPVCSGQICDGTKPRQCVAWLDGTNVRAKCETPVAGWLGDFTLSSANVGDGQIRRLVGVSEPGAKAPALLALNSANQVLVNWNRSGAWQGWCVARTLHSSIDVVDFAATQDVNGFVRYKVNVYDPLTSDAVFFEAGLSANTCPNASGTVSPQRETQGGLYSRFVFLPASLVPGTWGSASRYALREDGRIRADFSTFGARFFTPPEPFRALAARAIVRASTDPDVPPTGSNRDDLYGIASDGSVWHAEVVHESSQTLTWSEIP